MLFYDFMSNIDDFSILKIQEHSSNWFSKEFPLDIVEEFYKSPVKLSRNKKVAPKLRVKIPVSKGNINCDIYDSNKNITAYTDIKKNDKVICILQFLGLRFLKQQVISEWIPLQIKICESKNKVQSYIINDNLLTDDEDCVFLIPST